MVEDQTEDPGASRDTAGFGLLMQFLSEDHRPVGSIENEVGGDRVDMESHKAPVTSPVETPDVSDAAARAGDGGDSDDAVLRVIATSALKSPSGDDGSPDGEDPSSSQDETTSSATGTNEMDHKTHVHELTIRELPRVIAIANQKGGVGKTTTTINLGACLAELGYRTLIVDLDPQANATTGLGIGAHELELSMYDVILAETPMEDCVEATSVKNLFIAPASLDLAGAEIELVPAMSREHRLKRAIDSVVDDYDYVLIDCPPSLGLLTVNALAAAAEVLVPIQCEYFALEGLGQLIRNVDLVQRNLNPDIELSTIVLVMYDARTKLAEQVAQEVRDHFGDKVLSHVVPRTVRLSEAPSFGQPIITFDPSSRGAAAYREIAREVSGGEAKRVG